MGAEETDEQHRDNYEIAEAIAPGWERQRGFIEGVASPVQRWLIEALAPQPGDTVLELACGAADTGFEAAALIGEGGRLVATDLSPSMIEVARRRGAERGVQNVEYRAMDAERLELGDDSVDGVLCRFGFMLMPDPGAALAETRRVLRPGGRVALGVWGPPDRNPFFTVPAMALVKGGHIPPPDPTGPGVFSMSSPERIRDLLEGAGFGEARVEEVGVHVTLPGVDEYLQVVEDTAGPLAIVLRGLGPEELGSVRDDIAAALADRSSDGGYELSGVALCAAAS